MQAPASTALSGNRDLSSKFLPQLGSAAGGAGNLAYSRLLGGPLGPMRELALVGHASACQRPLAAALFLARSPSRAPYREQQIWLDTRSAGVIASAMWK